MQLHDMKSHVERSGDGVESSFVIKNSAKAFTILSSTLYSDKIGAIVRELSCNAYDAHVVVGKGDIPFEIKLPNSLDPTFHVKDYGPGLSDAQIIGENVNGVFVPGIYQTFFDSTKTDSDEFIGALGLGCKSPFSYTSMFMVESRQNGVKRFYTAFKDEQNKPAIRFMAEEETTEDNGLTVSLSVRKDDISKFIQSAKKQLMYFNPAPSVKGYSGFKPFEIKHTTGGSNWKLREAEYSAYMKGPHVVQGFVAYPIDAQQFDDRKLPASVQSLLGIDIDLYVPIGQVEPAPSREALSYDNDTINNLITVLEVAAKEMHASFQQQFDKCATLWDACIMKDNLVSSSSWSLREMFSQLVKMKAFVWENKVLSTKVELILDKVVDTSIFRYSTGHKNLKLVNDGMWNPSMMDKKFDIYPRKNVKVLIDKSVKGNNPTVLKYLADTNDVDHVIVLRPTQGHSFNQKEVDEIVNSLGNPDTIFVDTLPAAKSTTKSTYVKRAPEEKLVWLDFPEKRDYQGRNTGKRREFSRLCWKREMIDLNAGGFYVNIDRFLITDISGQQIDLIIKYAAKLGIILSDPTIVGFNEKDLQQVKGNSKWVNFIEFVVNAVNANKQAFTNFLAYKNICDNVRVMSLAQKWSTYCKEFVDGDFKKYVTKLSQMVPIKSFDSTALDRILTYFGLTINVNSVVQTIENEWDTITHKYSMLKYIVGYEGTSTILDVAVYVNTVDKP